MASCPGFQRITKGQNNIYPPTTAINVCRSGRLADGQRENWTVSAKLNGQTNKHNLSFDPLHGLLGKKTVLSSNHRETPAKTKKWGQVRQRYDLLRVIKKMARRRAKKDGVKHASKVSRVAICQHRVLGNHIGVFTDGAENSYFNNLFRCGMGWLCPCCSINIQEKRRVEIEELVALAYQLGKKIILITLTAPHRPKDSLKYSLDKRTEALRWFRSGSTYQKLKSGWGYCGGCKATEVTVGLYSGWHPHFHELWVVDRNADADAEDIKKVLSKRWEKACLKVGLLESQNTQQINAFRDYGLDIQDEADCSSYLTKIGSESNWGVDAEVAKGNSKTSKKWKNLHPFNLLALYKAGHSRAYKLWNEYIDGTYRRTQFQFFPGTKEWVKKEKTKQKTKTTIKQVIEENNEVKPSFRSVYNLSITQWNVIIRLKKRAFIRELAVTHGRQGIEDWFESISEENDFSIFVPEDPSPMWGIGEWDPPPDSKPVPILKKVLVF